MEAGKGDWGRSRAHRRATLAKVDGFGVKDVAEMFQKSQLQLMGEMPHPKRVDKAKRGGYKPLLLPSCHPEVWPAASMGRCSGGEDLA